MSRFFICFILGFKLLVLRTGATILLGSDFDTADESFLISPRGWHLFAFRNIFSRQRALFSFLFILPLAARFSPVVASHDQRIRRFTHEGRTWCHTILKARKSKGRFSRADPAETMRRFTFLETQDSSIALPSASRLPVIALNGTKDRTRSSFPENVSCVNSRKRDRSVANGSVAERSKALV